VKLSKINITFSSLATAALKMVTLTNFSLLVFPTVFSDASDKTRTKTFTDTFAAFLLSLTVSDKTVDQGHTWIAKQLDAPFCSALTKSNWLACPLNRDRTSIGHMLSAVHCCPVDPKLADFSDRVQRELDIHLQLLADEEKSKIGKKETQLYYKGLHRDATHVRAVIYNRSALGKFIAPEDFARSALWFSLRDYLKSWILPTVVPGSRTKAHSRTSLTRASWTLA
jgi:hypothetical protein